jgi:hypothetical protein
MKLFCDCSAIMEKSWCNAVLEIQERPGCLCFKIDDNSDIFLGPEQITTLVEYLQTYLKEVNNDPK